ncbi:hypothetical protein P1S61_03250 [Streptomyces sp. ME08-AFT2]|uniref:hypothetical protein n=1 Tax=Streptomyces sp. ME08-AFT2 TaxID=3028683 RepID=UPI0029B3B426|nr:hypothetical protein [Streptomyces sp. ME08-AFT2]MDX3308138.1 hypothetical protein [Streptomyces sp. ME08-AFT2]
MAIRTAHSGGGMAVRWAYGVFLTLCVALAVLVHHETSMTSVMSMTTASPTSVSARMPAPAHAAHAMADAAHAMAGKAAPSASESSAHGVDSGACAMPGMQHCTTASVGSVQLAAPGQSTFDPPADLERAAEGRVPASAVGRAPPDLSVLSQLRI